MAGNNKKVIYWALILFLLWIFRPIEYDTGGGGWQMCLDYLEQGKLYNGESFCSQGPVIFYVGYIMRRVLGGTPTIPMITLGLACNLAIFLMIREILKRQGINKPHTHLLLHVLLIYPFAGIITSTLSTTFLVAGYYLINKQGGYTRTLASAAAFTLAIFTKYTTTLPAIIIIGYALAKTNPVGIRRSEGKIIFSYKSAPIIASAAILLTIIATYAMLTHTYPNFKEYTITSHSSQLKSNIMEGMRYILEKRDLSTTAAAIVIATLAFCAIRGMYDRETMIYPLVQATLVFYGILFSLTDFMNGANVGSHYMLPAYPFLIGAIMALEKHKRIFALLILLIVIYPSLTLNPLVSAEKSFYDVKRVEIIKEVQYGLHFIPPQKGYVLMEGTPGYENTLKEYGAPIPPQQVELANSNGTRTAIFEDNGWAPLLRRSINATIKPYITGNTSQNDARISKDLTNGRYSLIIVGPPSWLALTEILDNNRKYVTDNYHILYLPNYQYIGGGRIFTEAYFQDYDDYMNVRSELVRYYGINFNEICNIGKITHDTLSPAQVVTKVMNMNGLRFKFSCDSDNMSIYGYDEKYKTRAEDVLIAMLLYLPTYLAVLLMDEMEQAAHQLISIK